MQCPVCNYRFKNSRQSLQPAKIVALPPKSGQAPPDVSDGTCRTLVRHQAGRLSRNNVPFSRDFSRTIEFSRRRAFQVLRGPQTIRSPKTYPVEFLPCGNLLRSVATCRRSAEGSRDRSRMLARSGSTGPSKGDLKIAGGAKRCGNCVSFIASARPEQACARFDEASIRNRPTQSFVKPFRRGNTRGLGAPEREATLRRAEPGYQSPRRPTPPSRTLAVTPSSVLP